MRILYHDRHLFGIPARQGKKCLPLSFTSLAFTQTPTPRLPFLLPFSQYLPHRFPNPQTSPRSLTSKNHPDVFLTSGLEGFVTDELAKGIYEAWVEGTRDWPFSGGSPL